MDHGLIKPIGSMELEYLSTFIYHRFKPYVGKFTSPMEQYIYIFSPSTHFSKDALGEIPHDLSMDDMVSQKYGP